MEIETDFKRLYTVEIPMEIEPEPVDMRTYEERQRDEREYKEYRKNLERISKEWFNHIRPYPKNLIKYGDSKIQKYPIHMKFDKIKDYIVGLGHIWQPVYDIDINKDINDYIYWGEQLLYKKR